MGSSELTVGPAEQGSDKLENLELLRVASVKREKVEKMISDNLPIDIVLRPTFAQDAQSFG